MYKLINILNEIKLINPDNVDIDKVRELWDKITIPLRNLPNNGTYNNYREEYKKILDKHIMIYDVGFGALSNTLYKLSKIELKNFYIDLLKLKDSKINEIKIISKVTPEMVYDKLIKNDSIKNRIIFQSFLPHPQNIYLAYDHQFKEYLKLITPENLPKLYIALNNG